MILSWILYALDRRTDDSLPDSKFIHKCIIRPDSKQRGPHFPHFKYS